MIRDASVSASGVLGWCLEDRQQRTCTGYAPCDLLAAGADRSPPDALLVTPISFQRRSLPCLLCVHLLSVCLTLPLLSFQHLIFLISPSGSFHLSIPLTMTTYIGWSTSVVLSLALCHIFPPAIGHSFRLGSAGVLTCGIQPEDKGEVWGECTGKPTEKERSNLLRLVWSTDLSPLGNQRYCHLILSLASTIFFFLLPPYRPGGRCSWGQQSVGNWLNSA